MDYNLIKSLSRNFRLRYFGPESQRNFLINLGILERAKILKNNANLKQIRIINNSLNFLINKNKMGNIYQAISISNYNLKNIDGF